MPRLRLITSSNRPSKITLAYRLKYHYDVPLDQYINPDKIELILKKDQSNPLKRSKLAQTTATGQSIYQDPILVLCNCDGES